MLSDFVAWIDNWLVSVFATSSTRLWNPFRLQLREAALLPVLLGMATAYSCRDDTGILQAFHRIRVRQFLLL